jgi:hypothetical protein
MTTYGTQFVENWVFDVKCLYYVYEIKHRRLNDHIYNLKHIP